MAKENSIIKAMNIEEEWGEKINTILNDAIEDTETVSGLLEQTGESVREEELGSIQTPLTKYEKKLHLAGFFAGHNIADRKSSPLGMLGAIIGGSIIKKKMEEEDGEEG